MLNEIMKLAPRYIHFASTIREILAAKMMFSAKFGMSGIIVAVDGTHVAIIKPAEIMNRHMYYNRKHFYSLNMLAACNADMKIIHADAQYPGSTHDATLQEKIADDGATFLLGDSGYTLTRCLLT